MQAMYTLREERQTGPDGAFVLHAISGGRSVEQPTSVKYCGVYIFL